VSCGHEKGANDVPPKRQADPDAFKPTRDPSGAVWLDRVLTPDEARELDKRHLASWREDREARFDPPQPDDE
jgi:hypothetical protein